MIEISYWDHGQRPSRGDVVADTAYQANTLPASFEVIGVRHGRRIDRDTIDNRQFALRVEPPSDNISQDAIDAIATAFEDNWGGSIEFVESIVQ